MLNLIQQRCLEAAQLARLLIGRFREGNPSPELVEQLLQEVSQLQQLQGRTQGPDSSVLATELLELKQLLKELELAGQDWIHTVANAELEMLIRGQRMQRAYLSRNG